MHLYTLTGGEKGWWTVSLGGRVWLPKGELPFGLATDWGLVGKQAKIVGEWQGENVWLIYDKMESDMCSPRLIASQDEKLFKLVGRGVQLAEFYRSHRFCGYCGAKMRHSESEWACLCDNCHERYYPQIAPCIIVGIRNKDKILLAHHVRHKHSPLYTLSLIHI